MRPEKVDRMQTFRPAHPGDAEAIAVIHRHDHVTPFVSERSTAEIRASIANLAERYLVLCGEAGDCLGFSYLFGLDGNDQRAELRQLAVASPGQGHGAALLRQTVAFVFEHLLKNRLWLDVFPQNAPARALYARHGFVEEGTLREAYLLPSGFQSTIVMSILARDYYAARRQP
ncbi:MAG: GNAT family protein [Pseudomonadota bacterium]